MRNMRRSKFYYRTVFVGLIFLGLGSMQESKAQISLGDLLGISQADIDNVYKPLGFGLQHRFYQPADTLKAWDFELAIEATAIKLNDATVSSLKTFSPSTSLSLLPIAKLQIVMGLPEGFEFGVGWLGGVQALNLWSFGVSRNWIKTPLFEVDSRASLAFGSLSSFGSTNWSLDGIISFPMGIIEPYAFLGVAGASISLNDLSAAQLANLAGISTSQSYTSLYLGVGFPLMFGFFQLRPELQYFTIGELSFGTRLAFVF